VIRGPHGELLSSAYYAPESEVVKKNGKRISGWHWSGELRDVVMRSLDGGKSWEEFGTIAALPEGTGRDWMGSEGPNEGSLALLSDGRLYAVFRTSGHGRLGNCWSADGGRTWTEPASMGFDGVAPRLHRLHNGMLAFVTGRPGPVVLRINPDGKGEQWSRPWTIYTGRSTCYVDFTEVKPGRLLVVYDNVPYGWYQIAFADRGTKNRIFGTFVDVTDGTN
jgi:BNR repeat-like domain